MWAYAFLLVNFFSFVTGRFYLKPFQGWKIFFMFGLWSSCKSEFSTSFFFLRSTHLQQKGGPKNPYHFCGINIYHAKLYYCYSNVFLPCNDKIHAKENFAVRSTLVLIAEGIGAYIRNYKAIAGTCKVKWIHKCFAGDTFAHAISWIKSVELIYNGAKYTIKKCPLLYVVCVCNSFKKT